MKRYTCVLFRELPFNLPGCLACPRPVVIEGAVEFVHLWGPKPTRTRGYQALSPPGPAVTAVDSDKKRFRRALGILRRGQEREDCDPQTLGQIIGEKEIIGLLRLDLPMAMATVRGIQRIIFQPHSFSPNLAPELEQKKGRGSSARTADSQPIHTQTVAPTFPTVHAPTPLLSKNLPVKSGETLLPPTLLKSKKKSLPREDRKEKPREVDEEGDSQ